MKAPAEQSMEEDCGLAVAKPRVIKTKDHNRADHLKLKRPHHGINIRPYEKGIQKQTDSGKLLGGINHRPENKVDENENYKGRNYTRINTKHPPRQNCQALSLRLLMLSKTFVSTKPLRTKKKITAPGPFPSIRAPTSPQSLPRVRTINSCSWPNASAYRVKPI